MAMLGLSVPAATARILSEIEVPGKREDVSHFHITLLFLGDEIPIETISEMMVASYEVARSFPPFTVSTSEVTTFPKGTDGYPVICPIASPTLYELHSALCQKFDDMGLDYSKKFPVYRPHVTLSYTQEEFSGLEIPPVSWGAHELTLWGGDSGAGRILVTIPMSLQGRAASAGPSQQDLIRILMKDRLAWRFQAQQ